MKKLMALLLALTLALGLLCACAANPTESTDPSGEKPAKVYKVCNLVNGNLGDKSFYDSAQSGLDALKAAGRIESTTIEMGGTDADQPKWLSTLYEVSEGKRYDLIICGTWQMPEYLAEVAAKYPEQKYLIYDSECDLPNVVSLNYKQNDMGYLVGVFAACMTTDTSVKNINADAVLGFVGGEDSPVINDFLYGFILGAQSVNQNIRIDTRYTGGYVDTALAKEYALSMINDNKCDIIWGVAGNAGNGAAEAALETGKAWFIGVDSDQELTFSEELAAITLTSGLKNIGQSLVWFFDEWDAGRGHFGENLLLGIAEGGVGIVTDKNFKSYASAETIKKVEEARKGVLDGTIKVPTAIGNESKDLENLRESVRP